MMEYLWLYLVVLATTLSVTWYFLITKKNNYWKRRGIPFEKPVPFFGNALDVFMMRSTVGEICQKVYNKYRTPYVGMFMLGRPILLIRDLDLVKNILVKDFYNFDDRTWGINRKTDKIGSSMLFLARMPEWGNLRKHTSPAFSLKKIKQMHMHILETAGFMMDHLKEITEINNIIEVREVTNKYAANAITSTAFGVKANCFTDANDPYRYHANRVFNSKLLSSALQTICFTIFPGLVEILGCRFLDNQTGEFLLKVFWETVDYRKKTGEVRNDIVDSAIGFMEDEDVHLDKYQLAALSIQFFAAGYESSSSFISYGLYELAKNPDVQKQLREEILRVHEQHNGFSYDALDEMDFLEMVVKETIRMYPILAFLDRKSAADYDLPGLVLEKGIGVYIPVMGIHFDPEYYPDPHRFDPLRFSPESIRNRPAYTFLSFGEGPRHCIGRRYGKANVKTALAHILSQYEVRTCSKTQSKIEFNPVGALLQPKNGAIHLEFVKL